MNFLAHLYLSGDEPHVQIGNFIGDHVKGRDYEKYPPLIKKGILLHRQIDYFTDTHPVVKKSSQRLSERYGRYAGIITDVFYDHFLGVNWSQYSTLPLGKYVTSVHRVLLRNYFTLPGAVKRFLPFMVKSRRLEGYATKEGIRRSLQIMANYSSLPEETDWAMQQMDKHYLAFNDEFKVFFEDVRQMAANELALPDHEGE
ncbi:ACP phosphodiesterase [Carboxylicivirga taeanensis]|uniref:acyl carrier protein phosphodiesterase n=1 Tax=Carboxylicivirga taeanensis TaxID=1416875 RepID=UPI003F6E2BEB